ncbi:hypothetical protein MAR_028631 [Mya arenaria]|uniref:Uncharacterized protein n=1 Tax=Mya arenaria TaxID=6604 RepID=A0ABY7DG38_MYAAR|nr:hypothetical protein MAR_028578 [Mya arenaria]WAQ95941.1 hypothetical protein MAR_028631 [Mya arenaria]
MTLARPKDTRVVIREDTSKFPAINSQSLCNHSLR